MFGIVKVPVKTHRVVIAGDAHYWPEKKPPTAHRGLVYILETLGADLVIFNGDALDAASISKYPPKGWIGKPKLNKELEVTKKRLMEIRKVLPAAQYVYNFGNHEERFDKRLAKVAGQYKDIPGMSFAEHFPHWTCAERVDLIGKERCVVKHEMAGGANPLKSNLLKAGCHVVTGHLHNQNVLAQTDYSGTRYAVDHGMLGRPTDPQFDYGENNPVNWRSGFVYLQWFDGRLMPPMLATVLDEKKGVLWLNGHTYKV